LSREPACENIPRDASRLKRRSYIPPLKGSGYFRTLLDGALGV